MRQLRRRNPRRRELRRWQSRRRQLRRRQRRRDKPRRRQLRREKPRRKQLRRRKLRMRKPRRRQPRRRQLRRDNASKQAASKEEASKEAASKEASSKSIHPRGPRKCRPGRKGPRAEVLGAGLPAGRGSAGEPGHVRRCLAVLLPVAEGKKNVLTIRVVFIKQPLLLTHLFGGVEILSLGSGLVVRGVPPSRVWVGLTRPLA